MFFVSTLAINSHMENCGCTWRSLPGILMPVNCQDNTSREEGKRIVGKESSCRYSKLERLATQFSVEK